MQVINLRKINLLLGSALLAAGLAGCDARGEAASAQTPPAPDVEVAVVHPEQVTLWGSFSGRIASPEMVELRPRASGYIEQVAFSEGELVTKGDVLFLIDKRQYQAREQLAQAELARMQSELKLASSEARRATQLWERRAISHEELDERKAALVAAHARVNAASATLRIAQLELAYTEVRAPITGRIGRAEVSPGDLVTADISQLATLVSMDPIHVYFESDQQTAQVNPAGPDQDVPVRVALENESGSARLGRLDFIDNRYNSDTGTLQYRAVLPNSDNRFKPGQFAHVEMPVTAARQTLLVDQKAVLTDQDRRYVYVLDDDNLATRRYVEIGRRVENLLVITEGLVAGDRIIVNGVQKVAFPGMQVAPELVDMRRGRDVPTLAGHPSS